MNGQLKYLQNKRVLVTGGAGFIGSNLCEDMLTHGNTVICLDNFSTGHRRNIAEFLPNDKFTLIEGDIRNLDDCRKAATDVDVVFHQAALGSVPRSIKDPITTNEVNITGFLNMLVAARDAGVQRFVYAASSSVYGDSPELPKVEEIIGNPISPYGVSKYANELYARVFALNYGMKVIGLRYFNVFGRRQDPEGPYAAVIPRFTKLLMEHKSPEIYGDGTNSRDFTYIDNVVQMNHLAAVCNDPQANAQVFNTAVGEENDLNTLVKLLKEYLVTIDPAIGGIEPLYSENRNGDIPHSLASIEKAKNILGYTPTHRFAEGLKEAVEWYRRNLR